MVCTAAVCPAAGSVRPVADVLAAGEYVVRLRSAPVPDVVLAGTAADPVATPVGLGQQRVTAPTGPALAPVAPAAGDEHVPSVPAVQRAPPAAADERVGVPRPDQHVVPLGAADLVGARRPGRGGGRHAGH